MFSWSGCAVSLETNAVCPVLLVHLKKMESDQFVFTTGTPTERQINIISWERYHYLLGLFVTVKHGILTTRGPKTNS